MQMMLTHGAEVVGDIIFRVEAFAQAQQNTPVQAADGLSLVVHEAVPQRVVIGGFMDIHIPTADVAEQVISVMEITEPIVVGDEPTNTIGVRMVATNTPMATPIVDVQED